MKILAKGMMVLLALLILLPAIPTAEAAAKTQSAKVKVDILNVREKDSVKSKKVGTLKKGAQVTVYSKTESGWSEIRFKKKKAYVTTKYLDFKKAAFKVSTYKFKGLDELKYAQIKGMKNKNTEKKINSSLYSQTKPSFKEYTAIKRLEAKNRLEDPEICVSSPGICNLFYELSYKTKYNRGNSLSIVYTAFSYEGGTLANHELFTYNFNLSNGKRIKLHEVLNTKEKRAKVQKFILNYVKNRPNEFYHTTELRDIGLYNNRPFYYTNGGIYIIFESRELTMNHAEIKVPTSVYK